MTDEVLKPGLEFINLAEIQQLSNGKFDVTPYGKNFRILLIGESHWDQQMIYQQLDLIGLVKPDYVLDEKFKDWNYNPMTHEFEKQKGRIVDKIGDKIIPILPHYLIDASDEIGFKVIGCDLSHEEINRFSKALPSFYPGRYKRNGDTIIRFSWDEYHPLSFSELCKEPTIMGIRDRHMIKTAFAHERKSIKPVILIVGDAHAQNINEQESLIKKNKGYIYVGPFRER